MSQLLEIAVPDIGDFDEVEVVEILVAKGDAVEFDDPLVSIESDKATMEIPSTTAGIVVELRVAEGDRVSEGSVLVVIDAEGEDASTPSEPESKEASSTDEAASSATPGAETTEAKESNQTKETKAKLETPAPASSPESPRTPRTESSRVLSSAAANPIPDRTGLPHASPLVRRYARELGVPIEQAKGTGDHGRILIDDLKQQVRDRFATNAPGQSGSGVPQMPVVDHAAFGPTREEKLTRIQKVSGPVLHRSWLNVPHVTQHDEADVTELERFRKARATAASERGVKLSPLLFVMKAVVIALAEFPTLRASLAPEGDHLVIKEYFHLGIAVDTEQGLVVPVIRDVDQKGIFDLAEELSATAARARDRKLGPEDLRGACFSISSLGGIGGTAFSPIVNAPEVAILGLSKTRVAPVWDGPSPLDLTTAEALPLVEANQPPVAAGEFRPRLILPFSLSYDHRVIDGAEAVRFTTRLSRLLADPAQLLL